jgi:dipeptidyl aminopeptidase/acylaminoacyl peptidase
MPFVTETNFAYAGPFSPDGAKFMFVSGPPVKLSVANADASRRQEVISPEASQISSGSWSPDGQRLVYDAAVKGNNDIYVVDITGRNLERLTRDAAIDGVASWSRDGARIYFTSTRAGAVPDIWRIPAQGGEAVRITYHGGIYSQESLDGKYLYYADRPRDGHAATAKLMRVPVGGGPEIALQDRLTTFWWRVAQSGIYFIRREADFDAIDRYEYRDGRVVRVGRLSGRAGPIGSKMIVSPDERWALVPQENRRSDLMLLDNFR